MLGQGKISFDDTEKTGRGLLHYLVYIQGMSKSVKTLTQLTLTFSRPKWVSSKNAQFFIGRQIKIDVNEGELVKLEHFK